MTILMTGCSPLTAWCLRRTAHFLSGRVNPCRRGGEVRPEIIHGMSTILKEMALTFRDTAHFYLQAEQFPAAPVLCWLIPLRTGHQTSGNISRQKGCLMIMKPLSN